MSGDRRLAAGRRRDPVGQARPRGGVPAPAGAGARRHAARADLHQRGAAPGSGGPDPLHALRDLGGPDRSGRGADEARLPQRLRGPPAGTPARARRAEVWRPLRGDFTFFAGAGPPNRGRRRAPAQRRVRSAAVGFGRRRSGSVGGGRVRSAAVGFGRRRWVRSAASGSVGGVGFGRRRRVRSAASGSFGGVGFGRRRRVRSAAVGFVRRRRVRSAAVGFGREDYHPRMMTC